MNGPLISVITTAYNREFGLLGAINSVNKQTYTNWEHLVIGDCWEPLFERFGYLASKKRQIINLPERHNNLGLTPFNEAVKIAQGEWIAVCADDNLWTPDHLEKMVDLVGKHPNVDFAWCSTEIRAKDGSQAVQFRDHPWPCWSQVDLGDCFYRRSRFADWGDLEWLATDDDIKARPSIFEWAETSGYQYLYAYSYDWRLLEKWIRKGATFVHGHNVTHIYYVLKEPPDGVND